MWQVTVNKEQQGKCRLITDMFGSVKPFRFQLRLLENQLDAHNLVYCPHLEQPKTHFPWVYLIIFQERFLRREALHDQFQDPINRNRNLRFSLALWWQAFRRLETIWKWNSSIFNVTPTSDQNIKIFVLTPHPPKKKSTEVLWAEWLQRSAVGLRMCENFVSFINNNKIKSRSRATDGTCEMCYDSGFQ